MFEVQNKDGVVIATYDNFDDADEHAQRLNYEAAADQYFGVWWDEDEEEAEETGNEWWELDDAQEAWEQHYRDLTTY